MIKFKQARINCLFGLLTAIFACADVLANKPRPPSGGQVAVIVDERLSALRDAPTLSGRLLRRIGRGKLVAITGLIQAREGIVFYRVIVTRRTHGWIQREALIVPRRLGEDQRLLRLIEASDDFERIARARIFLDTFSASPLKPAVLLLFGDAAEQAAEKLSREALRRLRGTQMPANGAPLFSYFLNYSGLDRYNRQGIRFVFNVETRSYHYDGSSWREILRRYLRKPEANEARERLERLKMKG